MTQKQRQQAIAGGSLIVLGLALYYLQNLGNAAVFILVGGAFLAGYFYRREFGFLIPGCLILGMGLGSLFSSKPFKIGLGIGFVAITIIGLLYERRFRWWPLIPGGLLIVLSLGKTEDLFGTILDHWQLILVVVGVLVLFGAFFRPKSSATE